LLLVLVAGVHSPGWPAATETGEEMPARYRRWLEEVDLLIGEEERSAFLELRHDYRRDAFIRKFWQLRDPYPQTPRNELKDRWEARAEQARQLYDSLQEDRARMLLLNGEPDDTFVPRCRELLLPMEIWYYRSSDLLRRSFTLVFISLGLGDRGSCRLWHPTEGVRSILHGLPRAGMPDTALLRQIVDRCAHGDRVVGALQMAASIDLDNRDKPPWPRPHPEWVRVFRDRSTDLPDGATTLPARLEIRFPGRRQSRTVVQSLVAVPAGATVPSPRGDPPAFQFLVDGEVLRGEDLFESFRYRFDIPVPGLESEDEIPLLLERYLRPGRYTLMLRARDLNTGGCFRHRQVLDVPVYHPTVAQALPGSPPPATDDSPPDQRLDDEVVLKLHAPPPQLLTGKVRMEAEVEGSGVHRVVFELNGKSVLSKRRPPYSVEMNLGDAPRTHTVRAAALDSGGEVVASDELLLNAGPHRFAVRLVEPRGGQSFDGELRAHAEVEIPRGETLDRVELYLNETLVATLFQPPFVQPIQLPRLAEIAYVRALAVLKDGSAAEDLVFVNAPDILDEMQVNFVELYTTVLDRRGRPVKELAKEEFEVLEDGEPQQIRRFEWVENLPMHAGVVLDTSMSMLEELPEAEEAAMRFFELLIEPKDRAAVIVFNDQPSLKVAFTNHLEVLAGGLAGLSAEGETALYDSLIYALYYFSGISGKRVLVLLSDGEDVSSRYSFEEALEFARRSGVAIYAIGLNTSSQREAQFARHALMTLSEETGGRFFSIQRASELDAIYEEIQKELRSQYLLAYQSNQLDDEDRFRRVEVRVSPPGLEAKTVRGYYP
jgi:Ca-activated chloride channel family protein